MFKLPELGYAFDALEPYIDAQTMEIHHDKHHAAYVTKLNDALEKIPEWQNRPIEEILKNIKKLPKEIRAAIQNNGGGHYNHTLFWEVMAPGGSKEIPETLASAFGGADSFKTKFTDTALGVFGSGWAWLVKEDDQIEIMATGRQDSPLMDGKEPILGLDVWEHAYYLKYQNRRPEYVEAWWNVVNWDVVVQRLNT